MATVLDWSSGFKTFIEVDDYDVWGGSANPVPEVVSRFQARASLMDAGLLADAELAISQAEPIQQLAWAEATEWRRDSPTIAAMADLLGLTSKQVDELFVSASKIVA